MKIKVYVIKYPDRKFYVLRWTDPQTGKTHSKSSKCTKKRDATEKAIAHEKALNAGDLSDDGSAAWDAFKDKLQTSVLSATATRTEEKVIGVLKSMDKFRPPSAIRDVNSRYLSDYAAWMRSNHLAESTIQSHMRHIKTILRWAVDNRYLPTMPTIPAQPRASKRKMMKGRPITSAEFDRFLASIPKVVDAAHVANYDRMARGLWLTGLRLAESMELSWDTSHGFHVIVNGDRMQLRIPDWAEKGHEDRVFPLPPDAVAFLSSIPESERIGYVFNPTFTLRGNVGRYNSSNDVSRVFSAIGEAADIVVEIRRPKPGEKEPQKKYASAHDFRRSFGSRWAQIVTPVILRELMRHSTIETTMLYYVGEDANRTQDEVYRIWKERHTL